MQKIKSITLRNFKYFYGLESDDNHNKIELNQNNLLLYGENGSGKSSIYWALYTFLQSCLKTDDQIEKYFDPASPENLRNRFSEDTDDSGIILEIVSESGTITKEISNTRLETNTTGDTTINRIIAGSDFINYKYLSKLYDFRNSQEIDLFEWFEREVLMFVDFEEAYTDNGGYLSSSTLASDWWQFICEAPATFTPNDKNYKTPKRSSDEYLNYVNTTIPKFIQLLKSFLGRITIKANKILKEEFNEVFEVDFDEQSLNCSYNNRIVDYHIDRPKIPLKIKFNHDKLAEPKQGINKPHTFLNEARLTAIALSIRLAMLDERLYDENSASLLVLDDLLLSLDMSHRDRVLDIILKKIDEYQILILTHDRAFYSLCKNRIENRFDTGWEFKEMYQHITKDDIPCPFIPDKKSYLDLAHKYLKEFDYPACANYLRKESERILKELLPNHLTIHENLDDGSRYLMLEGLISKFKTYFVDIGGDFTPFEKLKEHKDILMNPLSHDNIGTPIYKQELINSIEIIEELNKLKIHTVGLTDSENEIPYILKETDSNGDIWHYTFYLKEKFRAIKGLDNNWLMNNPFCEFTIRKNITQNTPEEDVNANLKLKKGHDSIRHRLGIKVAGSVPNDLKDIVYTDVNNLRNILI